jgi:hypothetical protein
MGYIELFLGKKPNDLLYSDVITFFTNARQELDKIEFKAYIAATGSDREKEDGVISTISAMLNSEGGLIIWGTPVGQIIPQCVAFSKHLHIVSKLLDYLIRSEHRWSKSKSG